MRSLRIVLLSLLAIGVALALAVPAVASDCGQVPVQIKPIGHPIWKPVDFHVFKADITNQQYTAQLLLHPVRHEWCTDLGIGPGEPHQPPYDKELEGGMDIANFTDSLVFKLEDFSFPNAVWAFWMLVPDPGTIGSSPDFPSGPIIPNTIFPITISGAVFRNNQLFDPFSNLVVPPLTEELSCPFNVAGHSHTPIYYWDWESLTGHYEFRLQATDVTGNGWFITVKFTVQQGK